MVRPNGRTARPFGRTVGRRSRGGCRRSRARQAAGKNFGLFGRFWTVLHVLGVLGRFRTLSDVFEALEYLDWALEYLAFAEKRTG